MGRIKIEDLPEDHKISEEEMRKVLGGMDPDPFSYPAPYPYSYSQQQFSYGYFTNPIQLRGTLPVPIP